MITRRLRYLFGKPRPSLDLNFTLGFLDSRVTYTGASLATLTDATGAIAYKPHNLALYSEDLTNAAWAKSSTSTSLAAPASPTGGPAYALVENTSTIDHRISSSTTVVVGVTYTTSVYLKAAGRTAVRLYTNMQGGTKSFIVDLTTGSVSASSMPNAPVSTSVGGGWWRVSYTEVADITSAIGLYVVLMSAGAENYTGDGTSGVYIWGAQLNIGTLQPYYPTTSAAYYGPRFTYDPVTLSALGLLIEEQRTNLCRNSEALNGTGWISTNQSVTLAAGTAPDGTSNANRLTATAGSGAKQTYNTVGSATTVTTNTIYAKAGTANWIALAFDVQGVTDGAFFNLATGVVGTVAASTTASITPVGNGWYRCSVTRTYASANHTITVEIHTADAQGVSWAAAGTETVLVWGAQLEAGAFATSYIPTTSASVTRVADSATMTGSNFSSWFNATQGTLYVEGGGSNAAGSARLVGISDGTTLNRIINYLSGATQLAGLVSTGGVAQANPTVNVTSAASSNKLAQAYVVNNVNVAANGTLGAADTSATIPTVTLMRIGADESGTGAILNGTIARLRYYNTALTNAQLQSLTK